MRGQTSIEYLLLIGAAVIFITVVALATRSVIFPPAEIIEDKSTTLVTAKASFGASPTGIILPSASTCIPGSVCGTYTETNSTCGAGAGLEASCSTICTRFYDSSCVCKICTPPSCNAACSGTLVISNVQVVPLGLTSARISWDTNLPSDGKVDYSNGAGWSNTELHADLRTSHSLVLPAFTGKAHPLTITSNAGALSATYSANFIMPHLEFYFQGVSDITGTTARVYWKTNYPTDLDVYPISLSSPPPGFGPSSSSATVDHSYFYNFLLPGKTYYSRIISDVRQPDSTLYVNLSNVISFATPAVGGASNDMRIENVSYFIINLTAVRIKWDTNYDSDGRVDYDMVLPRGLSSIATNSTMTKRHSQTLFDVYPESEYQFMLTSVNASGASDADGPNPMSIPPLYHFNGMASGITQTSARVSWLRDYPATLSYYALMDGALSAEDCPENVFDGAYSATLREINASNTLFPSYYYNGLLVKETGYCGRIAGVIVQPNSTPYIRASLPIYFRTPGDVFQIFDVQAEPWFDYAIIRWRTNKLAHPNTVKYGLANASYLLLPESDSSDSAYSLDHSEKITGLTPETTYYFGVSSINLSEGGQIAEDGFSFRTLGNPVISDFYCYFDAEGGFGGYDLLTLNWRTNYNASHRVKAATYVETGGEYSTSETNLTLTAQHHSEPPTSKGNGIYAIVNVTSCVSADLSYPCVELNNVACGNATGFCYIGNKYYPDGARHPTDPCRVCDASFPSYWSLAPTNTVCGFSSTPRYEYSCMGAGPVMLQTVYADEILVCSSAGECVNSGSPSVTSEIYNPYEGEPYKACDPIITDSNMVGNGICSKTALKACCTDYSGGSEQFCHYDG